MGRGKRRMRNAVGRQAIFNMSSRGSFKKASELAKLFTASELAKLFRLQMQIDENKVEETKQERLHVNHVEELKEEVLDLNRVCCKKQESLQELKDSYEGRQDESRSRTCDSLKKELNTLRRTALQVMGGIDQIEEKVNSIFEKRQIRVREFESPLLECEHVEAQYLDTTTALATQHMKSRETDFGL